MYCSNTVFHAFLSMTIALLQIDQACMLLVCFLRRLDSTEVIAGYQSVIKRQKYQSPCKLPISAPTDLQICINPSLILQVIKSYPIIILIHI